MAWLDLVCAPRVKYIVNVRCVLCALCCVLSCLCRKFSRYERHFCGFWGLYRYCSCTDRILQLESGTSWYVFWTCVTAVLCTNLFDSNFLIRMRFQTLPGDEKNCDYFSGLGWVVCENVISCPSMQLAVSFHLLVFPSWNWRDEDRLRIWVSPLKEKIRVNLLHGIS